MTPLPPIGEGNACFWAKRQTQTLGWGRGELATTLFKKNRMKLSISIILLIVVAAGLFLTGGSAPERESWHNEDCRIEEYYKMRAYLHDSGHDCYYKRWQRYYPDMDSLQKDFYHIFNTEK